ncbi:hypothetical protein [Candidatus Palauibacter sp.]|uniref:hypothetical protein n=1 Tax=Candidatus Palauibacter sp. TaxID=3101350 RepID=UPI003C6EA550
MATSRAVQAQQPTVLREDPQPPCEIELEPGPVFRGGGWDDENWVSNAYDVEALPGGRLAITEQLRPERFLVASADVPGGRWVGRGGEGPGEYRWIRWVRAHGDRLHVFDALNRRRTVLDATDFEVLHTNPLSPGTLENDAVVLDDSSYVINATMYAADRVGYVLHLMNGEGDVVRSFDEVPVGVPGAPSPFRSITPAARSGEVWSVSPEEYRIDLWDAAAGTRLRSLVREVEWFPPNSPRRELHPDQPGSPGIRYMTSDSRDRLWVMISVAAANWADCLVETPPGLHPEAGEYTRRENCSLYEQRIEVLDPGAGRILAAANFTDGFGAVDGGLLFSYETDAFGFPTLRFWRPSLRVANPESDRECAA